MDRQLFDALEELREAPPVHERLEERSRRLGRDSRDCHDFNPNTVRLTLTA